MFIYLFTNKINGKQYVGQTTHHKHWPCKCGSGILIKKAFKKYGKDKFIFDVLIDDIEFQKDLDNLEIWAIGFHNTLSPNGYNLAKGGKGGKHSKKSIENMKKAKTNVSEKTRKKISEAKKKYWSIDKNKDIFKTDKFKKAVSKGGKKSYAEGNRKPGGMLGIKHSEETKKKISKANKGQIPWNKGRKHSKESKQKMTGRKKLNA